MAALPQVKYTGAIKEMKLGRPGSELIVGGQTGYNFYLFEGKMPNAPRLALQVLDIEPEEWPPATIEPFKDVIGDPVAWAKKCVDTYKADIVCLWLTGTDPNGKNLSPEHAAETAKKVAEAVSVPIIVWGVSSDEKNTEVLKAVSEACSGMNLIIGPVTENNYKQVGAAAIAYGHVVAANSPIDINLAKQLNILLENLGVPADRILIDPTTGSVGYGMEYCYSIMERIRQAALTQGDDKLQNPIINNIAEEVWKTKEAKLPTEDEPTLGDAEIRGVNLEAITAISALQAGSDVLILRHPKTLEHVRKYIEAVMADTDLESMNVDMSLAPEEKAPAAAAPKPAAAKPAAPPKPKPAPAPAPAKPEPVEKPKPAAATPAPAAAPAAAAPVGVGDLDIEELTDDDVATLREMVATFKVLRNSVNFLARVLNG